MLCTHKTASSASLVIQKFVPTLLTHFSPNSRPFLVGIVSFDSSMDPALLAGVDDADDKDTSLAGVPVPNTTVATKADNDSDAECNHNSVDPNEADDNSSKASVHSTRSHLYLFTVPLVDHHNILWMRKTIFLKIKLSQMT